MPKEVENNRRTWNKLKCPSVERCVPIITKSPSRPCQSVSVRVGPSMKPGESIE